MNKADAKLKKALDKLLNNRDIEQTISNDPIQFAHRYKTVQDKELAAIFASFLAFGRVSLFLPVIQRWMTLCDERGGPRKVVEQFSAEDIPAFVIWLIVGTNTPTLSSRCLLSSDYLRNTTRWVS